MSDTAGPAEERGHRDSQSALRLRGRQAQAAALAPRQPEPEPDQLFFFRQQNSLFRQLCCFFAKWGLFFAKWGLFFASLYVHKSPAVFLNLGHPMAPLRFVCAI